MQYVWNLTEIVYLFGVFAACFTKDMLKMHDELLVEMKQKHDWRPVGVDVAYAICTALWPAILLGSLLSKWLKRGN